MITLEPNEVTHVPGLLGTLSLLDLAGCIVPVDALDTQRDIASKVKQRRDVAHLRHKAEFIMALKQNHPKLYEDVAWLFETTETEQSSPIFETHERSRGRAERRHCTILSDPSELTYLEAHSWPGLESVAKLSRERTVKGRTTYEVCYYLCSFEAEAEKLLQAVRTH